MSHNKDTGSITFTNFRVEKTLELYNKGSKQDEKMGGSIKIVIENHQDLTAL